MKTTIKRLVMLAAAALLLSGCMTNHMKATPFYIGEDVTYTGDPEDRVNLWPVAYWREPVGSVLWPVLSFGGDHFALRPVYSRYGAEHNVLWPIVQYNTEDKDGRVFPLANWRFGKEGMRDEFELHPLVYWQEGSHFNVFPVFWRDINGESFTVFPLYGHGKNYDWLFPLFYKDDDTRWITPFFGWNTKGDNWLLPFYANFEDAFLSLPYCHIKYEWKDGTKRDTTIIPPLLSGRSRYDYGYGSTCTQTIALLGIYGHEKVEDRSTTVDGKEISLDSTKDWLFPLYKWHSGDGCDLLLGFAGWKNDGSNWLFPLYKWHSGDGCDLLLGLAGWKNNGSSWLFPLYGYNTETHDIKTPIYGRITSNEGKTVSHYWLTPFVGTTSGDTSGFWLSPLVSWKKDASFDELEAQMNAERLDASIVGESRMETWEDHESGATVSNMVFRIKSASNDSCWGVCLDLFGTRRRIMCEGGDNERRFDGNPYDYFELEGLRREMGDLWHEGKARTVTYRDKTNFGTVLVFGEAKRRIVNFDYDTKEKVLDAFYSETKSLLGLVWNSRDEHVLVGGAHDYKKRAFLWRVFHYEELNGDSTTDVFPFITYDKKKDGHVKTSFLWRFFRWETDPKEGTDVDLLFIPVWRSSWFD